MYLFKGQDTLMKAIEFNAWSLIDRIIESGSGPDFDKKHYLNMNSRFATSHSMYYPTTSASYIKEVFPSKHSKY